MELIDDLGGLVTFDERYNLLPVTINS
jgi:hypothetical protein